MASASDILLPNAPDGSHQRRGERIERKRIDIGKSKIMDAIFECTLVDCEIHIHCGASSVSLFDSTLEHCSFHPKREMKGLRFTSLRLIGCKFFGKYSGCRFGNEDDGQSASADSCDFSQATLFHLCDFLAGADVGSMKWPPWPHIVVTDLPRSAPAWLGLRLPEELRIVQQVVGEAASFSKAVTIFLPAKTAPAEDLRQLLLSQSYVVA
jgi:hypothetical protein